MQRKKRAIEILWQKSKFRSILNIILLLILAYFLYASFSLSLELRFAIASIAVALIAIMSADYQQVIDAQKIDEILARLDNIQRKPDSLPKDDDVTSPLAEGVISIIKEIDHMFRQKR
ncbi:MAG: hypothetical protein HY670_05015 [Chloroflexi bacterium]|nr:hypothetical protein [Chloroflexota bacterium]